MFEWLKAFRKKVGKLALPDRQERTGRNQGKVNLKPYTPEPKVYLGQLAYLLLSNFEILTNELKYSPTTAYKAELSEAAAKSFEKYRTVSKKLSGLGFDPTDSMDPFVERIDTFHSRTAGIDWYESVIKIYLVSDCWMISIEGYRLGYPKSFAKTLRKPCPIRPLRSLPSGF